jgi:hypothetical protein
VNFSSALNSLKEGLKLTRANWNGKNQFVQVQVPDALSRMTLPYIYMTTVTGDRIPWVASHSDLLSNDWEIVS